MDSEVYDLEQRDFNVWYCNDIFLEGFEKIIDDFFGHIKQYKKSRIFLSRYLFIRESKTAEINSLEKIQLIRTDGEYNFKTELFYNLQYKLGPWVDYFISDSKRLSIGVNTKMFSGFKKDFIVEAESNYQPCQYNKYDILDLTGNI